jgi:hypothetical protein
MCARELGAQSFASLQLVRLDHHPAVTPPPPGKPSQWTFILVDDEFLTASLRGNLALT